MINHVASNNMVNFFDNFFTIGGVAAILVLPRDVCYVDVKMYYSSFFK